MLTQVHLLVFIVLAPGEIREAVHVTRDSQTVIRWRAFASFVPLVLQLLVHALGLFVALFTVVEDRSGQRVLDSFIAEGPLIVQSDVPAWFDAVVVGCDRARDHHQTRNEQFLVKFRIQC